MKTGYTQWIETLQDADIEAMHNLAESGKDFESEIPLLCAAVGAIFLTGQQTIDEAVRVLATYTEIIYWKGYQRGKKERALTFVVGEETADEKL